MPQDTKLEKFLEAINKEANERRGRIMAEVEQFNIDELSKATQDAQDDVVRLIEKEDAEIRGNLKAEMSRKEMESRRALLKKRENYFNKIFDAAAQKIREYARTDEYSASILASVQETAEAFLCENATIYIRPDEIVSEEELKTAFGRKCGIIRDQNIVLGGFIFSDNDSYRIVDNTLDAMLDEQRAWFIENSNLSVTSK